MALQGLEAGQEGSEDEDDSSSEVLPRKVGRREADLQARRQKYAAMRAAEARAREEAAREKAVQLKVPAADSSCMHLLSATPLGILLSHQHLLTAAGIPEGCHLRRNAQQAALLAVSCSRRLT